MTVPRTPRIAVLALLALLLALAVAAGPAAPRAQADDQMLSIMQDDDLLLYRGNRVRLSTMNRMCDLGVDAIRVTVLWEVLAENIRKRPRDPGNPASYPARNWERYDSLVLAADRFAKCKLTVLLNPTGPGPRWAHEPTRKRVNQRTWKPKPLEYAEFVEAVGRRYSGLFQVNGVTLPKVTLWSLWNEPNQGGWLTPQFDTDRTLRKQIAVSPIIYRELYLRGRRALDQTGHGNDTILLAETAPLGDPQGRQTDRKAMSPEVFLREMMCVAPNGRPYRGREATARKCGLFDQLGPIRTSGLAHHPYTKEDPPNARAPKGGYTMANVPALTAALDRYARVTRDLPRNLPVYMTEFGYETNPPDRFIDVTLDQQAQYINEGEYIAFKNPRVKSQTQFLLRDVAPVTSARPDTQAYWHTYQSGLYTFDPDFPKPAAIAYAFPLATETVRRSGSGGRVRIWGMLRFRPNGVQGDQVVIQFRPQGGTQWSTVGAPVTVTNPLGHFVVERDVPVSGSFRAVFFDSARGVFVFTREALHRF